MGQIRVVLLFNEENERQKEVGEYLKSQKRCKTALITELVYDWMQRKNGGGVTTTVISAGGIADKSEKDIVQRVKQELMEDEEFLAKIKGQKNGKNEDEIESYLNKERVLEDDGLDMDENLLLAGLSMFENQMG